MKPTVVKWDIRRAVRVRIRLKLRTRAEGGVEDALVESRD